MTESGQVDETEMLLAAVENGNESALDQLLVSHRHYLRRLVEHRIDPQLRARIDPSDVVQEVLIQVTQRIDEFLARRPFSFRIWLRRKVMDRLADEQRHHLRTQKRSMRREQSIHDVSSMAIAEKLMVSGPQQGIRRRELAEKVQAALGYLSELDREVLLMRYVEELSNAEVAELLQLEPDTARRRHGRAVQRLYQQLADTDFSNFNKLE